MVLEDVVKYLLATIILFVYLALGWFVSAKYLDPVILKIFNPDTHEEYLDIWFALFATIELVVLSGYVVYVFNVYMTNKHLTKSSSGH